MKAELKLKENAQEQLITYIKWQLKLYGRNSDRFDSIMGTVSTLFENPAEFWKEIGEDSEIKDLLAK